MNASHERRGFLRGLATLPLIGGGVTLIGQPTAVAEPVTIGLMYQYVDWLFYERMSAIRYICFSPEAGAFLRRKQETSDLADLGTRAAHWHDSKPSASTRAALVLSAVGCNWREDSKGA